MIAESTWYLREAAPPTASPVGNAFFKRGLQSNMLCVKDPNFMIYQFLPLFSISLGSQFEQGQSTADCLVLLVNWLAAALSCQIQCSLHLDVVISIKASSILKCTTWLARSRCFALMWVAMPELDVSFEEQPALPLLTNLLQWMHWTSRKSPSTIWKWVHQGLVGLPLPGMVEERKRFCNTL